MHPLSVLIKPASSLCNMRCKYCFYDDVTKNRCVKSYGIMDERTMENIVKKSIDYAQGSCSFIFQGGEPTLTGLEYYQKFVGLVNKYNKRNTRISYGLQTNGYDISKELAQFFADNKFLIGLSLDGTAEIHNRNRLDTGGKGTFSRVLNTANMLKDTGVEFNILTVVTDAAAKNIERIYNFYKHNNFNYQQYIPQIPEFGENTCMLSPGMYGVFLKKLFDLWFADICNNNYISVRYFDNIILMLNGKMPESCGINGRCSAGRVMESDGSVYPCDFYVLDKYKLGNINEDTFDDFDSSSTGKEFIEESYRLHEDCISCRWKGICGGGCKRDRQINLDSPLTRNRYCSAFKDFFNYSFERFKFLVVGGFGR